MSIRIEILALINERRLKAQARQVAQDVEKMGDQAAKGWSDGFQNAAPKIRKHLESVAKATQDVSTRTRDATKATEDRVAALQAEEKAQQRVVEAQEKQADLSEKITRLERDRLEVEAKVLKASEDVTRAQAAQEEQKRKHIATTETLKDLEQELKDVQLKQKNEMLAMDQQIADFRKKGLDDAAKNLVALQKEQKLSNREVNLAYEERLLDLRKQVSDETIQAQYAERGLSADRDAASNAASELTQHDKELTSTRGELKKATTELTAAEKAHATSQSAVEKADQTFLSRSDKVHESIQTRTRLIGEMRHAIIQFNNENGKSGRGGIFSGGGGGGNGMGRNRLSSFFSSFPGVPSSLPPVAGASLVMGGLGAAGVVAKAVVTATQALWLLPAAAGAAGAAFGTLAIATHGFGNAIKHMGDPKKFAQALAGLSPNAQQAALSIKALVDGPLGELKRVTQDAFFSGIGKELWDLTSKFKGPLQGLTAGVAGAFNNIFKSLGNTLVQPENFATIQHIFDNIKQTFYQLAPAASNFVNALLKITSVGSDFLPGLASSLSTAAQHFATFIENAQKSGKLKEWIQSGIDAVGRLGTALYTIGHKIYDIFATTNMDDFQGGLDGIVKILTGLGKAIEWLSKIVEYLSEHKEILGVILSLWGSFKVLGLAGYFVNLAGKIGMSNSALQTMTGLAGRAAGVLAGVGIAAGGWASIDGKGPFSGGGAAAMGVGGAIAGFSVGGPIGLLVGALGGLTTAVIKDTAMREVDKGKKDDEYNSRAPALTTPQARKRLHNQIYGESDLTDIDKIAKANAGSAPMPSPGRSAMPGVNPKAADALHRELEQRAKDGEFAFLGVNADNFKGSLDKIIKNAKEASDAVHSLGDTIGTLPTGEIVLKDPTPELIERVKQLGLKIVNLPGGKVGIDVNTDIAANKLQQFVEQWDNTVIRMQFGGIPDMPPGGPALNPQAPAALSSIVGGARTQIASAPSTYPGNFDVPAVPESGGGGDSASKRKDAFFNSHPELLNQFMPPELQGMDPNSLSQSTTASFAAAPGESPREFAHRVMMPFWQGMGFQPGDHDADYAGEHQNGALDIPIPNLQVGQQVLQEALSDPNVYGAIFNNATYGYGHGPTAQDYKSGHTGDPSKDHQNHVHIWYKPGDKNNLGQQGAMSYGPNGKLGYQNINEQAIVEAKQNVWKKGIDLRDARAEQAFINQDKDSSIEDKSKANEAVIEKGWEYNTALTKLNEAQQGTWKKLSNGANKMADGMQQIGAKIDDDFGISKGLGGIVENITKMLANLAFAPVFGALSGVTAANGTAGPGTGILGAFAPRQNAFGQDTANVLGDVWPTNTDGSATSPYGSPTGNGSFPGASFFPSSATPGTSPISAYGPTAPGGPTPGGPGGPSPFTPAATTNSSPPTANPGTTPATGPGNGSLPFTATPGAAASPGPVGGPGSGGTGTGRMPGGPVPQSYNTGTPWQLPNTTGTFNTPSMGVPLGQGMPASPGIGFGKGGLTGLAGSAITSAIGAAGMMGGGMDGGAGGAAASAVAQIGIDLAQKGISYAAQVGGILTQGAMETFLPVESQLADPTRGWFGRILGGVAGIRPVADNLAGVIGGAMKGGKDKPGQPGPGDQPLTPEQVAQQKAKDSAANTSNQNNNVKIDYTANGMTPDQNAETVGKLATASYGGNR